MEPQWIDYRSWHHDKKVMMHVSEIDFRKERVKGRAKDEVIVARFDEVALMPWTTYYDDSYNDVMIYEGDIVEVTHKDMKKRFVIDDEMGILLARCIEKEQYPFVDFGLDMLLNDDGRVKVIGNAYENPELLEPKEGSEKKGVRKTDISTKHIDEVIERAYLSGKSYVTLALTGDNNVDKALTRKLDEDGYKVALNDDNIMVSWGF